MLLGTIVVALVSHAFLVQNEFYATQTLRTGVQDNVRAATELMAREIRNAARDGIVVAGARTLTIRSPMAIGIVCNVSSPNADLMSEGGQDGLETAAVAGLALRSDSTWEYVYSAWAMLDGSDLNSADNCFSNGADTTGARDEYYRLASVDALFSDPVVEGSVLMLFRETTFTIETSALDPTTLGLFRADHVGTPIEFATGFDTTAQFQFRTSPGTYVDTVTAGSLGSVDAVRILADARRPPATGGREDVTFGWSVNVALRNMR